MSDDRYILDGKSFVDTKTNQCLNFGIKDLARVTITLNNMDMWLNQAEERIAELEEQLGNAIRPKFKVGQTVYTFNKNTECVYELCIKIIRIEINEISKFNSLVYLAERLEDGNFFGYFEVELFATKEEAQAKLKELQGENND